MVQIKNLTKEYGKFKALDNFNMEIEKGSIFGFVGPNGAGKTTTMRIIAGILGADGGEVYVDGIDALKNSKELKKKIGYMPDFFGVYDNLKVIEYMEFYASLYGLIGKEAKMLSYELLDLVHLMEQENSYVDELSRGMKQRLCLARSMVHDPQLLILDEPASGLDPRARAQMQEILKELHLRNKTILISSHILPELSKMCSHIGIIEKGEMKAIGTVEEIGGIGAKRPILITFVEGQDTGVDILKRSEAVQNIMINGNNISIIFKGNELEEAKLLQSLIEAGAYVSSFSKEESNLESLFMQLTKSGGGEVV